MYNNSLVNFRNVHGSLFSQLRFTGYGLARRVSGHGLKLPHPSRWTIYRLLRMTKMTRGRKDVHFLLWVGLNIRSDIRSEKTY